VSAYLVDIGGTFTDCVSIAPDDGIVTGKATTTPHDLTAAFLDAPS
jgi:N-methylhydantoinase A/oxoprolinase/acetone carboxylase beta subunit